MTEPLAHRPDVLVLAAGGTLGEAWMRGLLDGAGSATGIDFRDCEYFVGTSAGSIVAAFLASGRAPDSGAQARAAQDWAKAAQDNGAARRGRLSELGKLGLTAAAPFAPLALATTAPGGAVARAAALAAVPRPTRSMPGLGRLVDASGARFDGRLRIAAVDRRNGKRVMFGAPGSPTASVGAGRARVVLGAVDLRARAHRRARVRRRRRLEPDEPRRHAGAPRHRGPVPQPDWPRSAPPAPRSGRCARCRRRPRSPSRSR